MRDRAKPLPSPTGLQKKRGKAANSTKYEQSVVPVLSPHLRALELVIRLPAVFRQASKEMNCTLRPVTDLPILAMISIERLLFSHLTLYIAHATGKPVSRYATSLSLHRLISNDLVIRRPDLTYTITAKGKALLGLVHEKAERLARQLGIK